MKTRSAPSSPAMKVMERYDPEEFFLVLELYDQKPLYDLTESYHEMPRYCKCFDTTKLDRVLWIMSAVC